MPARDIQSAFSNTDGKSTKLRAESFLALCKSDGKKFVLSPGNSEIGNLTAQNMKQKHSSSWKVWICFYGSLIR